MLREVLAGRGLGETLDPCGARNLDGDWIGSCELLLGEDLISIPFVGLEIADVGFAENVLLFSPERSIAFINVGHRMALVRIAVREVLDRVWNHGEQHKSCIL